MTTGRRWPAPVLGVAALLAALVVVPAVAALSDRPDLAWALLATALLTAGTALRASAVVAHRPVPTSSPAEGSGVASLPPCAVTMRDPDASGRGGRPRAPGGRLLAPAR
jgi:hypothetical protein